MSFNTPHWRNKQLGNNLLQQEIQCYNWIKQLTNISWRWAGKKGYFFEFCKTRIPLSDDYSGIIIINYPVCVTPKQYVDIINSMIEEKAVDAIYMAINRYEFVSTNDLNIDYSDQLSSSIDQIVDYCKVSFNRLYNPGEEVDGQHFVGSHGLDVFVYERNKIV